MEILQKGTVSLRPKLNGNCAFPQNFRTRKLGEITVFFTVKGNKTGLVEDLKLYKIQQNVVTKFNKKLKKPYFKEKVTKRKHVKCFWNFCKPYFINKSI